MELAEIQTGNPYRDVSLLRDQLITEHLPYVKRIVNRIAVHLPANVVDTDDLVNAGII